MHVEIKVAQNFVLNFLYNKLPRRRVNLFGEELELALMDKFQDHWYPDMPFKGSAYRCLRVTDPNDPVLNRAARESGNPVGDIIENLPADLAIWIDPGEVSYRIGEKGSVKILYSECDNGLFGGHGGLGGTSGQGIWGNGYLSPNGSNGGGTSSSSASSGASDDLNAEVAGYLPHDNLNAAMNALTISNSSNSNSNAGSNLGVSATNLQQSSAAIAAAAAAAAAAQTGFTPFPPPTPSAPQPASVGAPVAPVRGNNQRPVTYTAGTFAQTKFGSTKLKSNGKKTNRMSPTEFSNYIKQRALQKQTSCSGHFNSLRGNGSNMNGFRPLQSDTGAMINNGFGSGGLMSHGSGTYGFNNHHGPQGLQHQMSHPPQSQANRTNRNLMAGNGSQFGNTDSLFYPLFPDRGLGMSSLGGGSSEISCSSSSSSSASSTSSSGNSSTSLSFPFGSGALGLGGTSSFMSGPNGGNNPWSLGDMEADTFLQDILSSGMQQQRPQNNALCKDLLDLGLNDSPVLNDCFDSQGKIQKKTGSCNSSSSLGLSGGLFSLLDQDITPLTSANVATMAHQGNEGHSMSSSLSPASSASSGASNSSIEAASNDSQRVLVAN